MLWENTMQLVEAHAEGEIGRVVTAGLPQIPGTTLGEKFRHLLDEKALRYSLCLEPRGAAAGSVVLLFPPEKPDNDAGIIILQPDQAHAMSGSNAICATTVLLETGMVPMKDGENIVRLETAAGTVVAKALGNGNKCESVTLEMPPSFVELSDFSLDTKDWGNIVIDIAFGGVFYALVDADQLGLRIEPADARKLADAGMVLKELLNSQLEPKHPINKDISGIAYVMFRQQEADGTLRTATTMWPGRLDRSPCGTGNSAQLAVLDLLGKASPGDVYQSLSTIGSRFQVQHGGNTKIGNRQAVLPIITGRGWIYGTHQLRFDPTDPFKTGFAMTDTWGISAGEIKP